MWQTIPLLVVRIYSPLIQVSVIFCSRFPFLLRTHPVFSAVFPLHRERTLFSCLIHREPTSFFSTREPTTTTFAFLIIFFLVFLISVPQMIHPNLTTW